MSFSDVIDPTIWVREKLSLALAGGEESTEPQLRRAIAALRAVHADLMARPERERTWISVLVVLFHDSEGMALTAGDCPCYRFRGGTLSRLGRTAAEAGEGPPEGALGSESQVRLEMVPLHPQAGDCYILATHSLREGELSLLARDLAASRDVAAMLRTACASGPETGRVAIAAVPAGEAMPSFTAPEQGPGEIAPLELEPIEPPATATTAERVGAPAFLSDAHVEDRDEPSPAAEANAPVEEAVEPEAAPDPEPEPEPEPAVPHGRAFVERRPWYEWIALWGGGALSVVALALLVRAILPGVLGKPRAKVISASSPLGTGSNLDLFSDPPGASVKVDGVPLPNRTPATDVAVAPGTHRVDMDWGVYGSRHDTIAVLLGGRATLRPRVLGSVGFRSSDPSRVLDVFVDGAYVGSTPVAMDSVVVGRHLVRFGSPGSSGTAQEVEVLQGTRVELIGNAGAPPLAGRVTVRSALLSDTGFESGRGDPVWVDGEMRGVTPLTVNLRPGAHSFRVLRRNFPPQITVIEVKPDGDQFVSAEFGAHSEEPLRYTPPTAISRSDPLPVNVSLPEGEWDSSMTVWLYAGPPGGSFQARPMTRLDSDSKVFTALVPNEVLNNASRVVRLYFKGVGAAGRELYSEIVTIPVAN